MKQIWKYTLESMHITSFDMPCGAEIKQVQMQQKRCTMWALVDPAAPRERRKFYVVGTGHDIHDAYNAEWLGTVQDGPFVWHVLEIMEKCPNCDSPLPKGCDGRFRLEWGCKWKAPLEQPC